MRSELENIERIEKFLLKQMTKEEQNLFEQELNNSPALKEQVNEQRVLLEGIRKKSFKQKANVAYQNHLFYKKLWNWGWGLGLSSVIILAGITIATYDSTEEIEEQIQMTNTKTVNMSDTNQKEKILLDSSAGITTIPSTAPSPVPLAENPKWIKEEIVPIKEGKNKARNNVSEKSEKKDIKQDSARLKLTKLFSANDQALSYSELNRSVNIGEGERFIRLDQPKEKCDWDLTRITSREKETKPKSYPSLTLLSNKTIKSNETAFHGASWKMENDMLSIGKSKFKMTWVDGNNSFYVVVASGTNSLEYFFTKCLKKEETTTPTTLNKKLE